jgi:hypothetical protein
MTWQNTLVRGLHNLGVRVGALDLLAEAVGVGDGQCRREPGGEVQGQRQVEEDLASEVARSHQGEGLERRGSAGGIEDELGMRTGLREGQQPDARMLLLPL